MAHQSALIESDIDSYLQQQEHKELLRFLTCGSVDDGKSTLIGRLLHDAQLIYEDQLKALSQDSVKSGSTGTDIDLALLVDGLQAEREQGITIDVAYRFFSTARRKFIIADTPGHEQYTRNMATGASTAQLALILIDARNGVLTQTLRHSMIAALLGIRHFIVAINKMDQVDYSEQVFNSIRLDYTQRLSEAELLQDLHRAHFVPLSALKGDNVVKRSQAMPWYGALPLLELLETLPIEDDELGPVRLPVQYVNRPSAEFRGYCGNLASGIIDKGQAVTILPAGKTSRIHSILNGDQAVDRAHAPMAITLTLEDAIDVSRGDMIASRDGAQAVLLGTRFLATIIWMGEAPLSVHTTYELKFASRLVSGRIDNVLQHIDPNTLGPRADQGTDPGLQLNEIADCRITLQETIACDPYRRCAGTGAFIVIDRLSNLTVAAGMITEQAEDTPDKHRQGHSGMTVCLPFAVSKTGDAGVLPSLAQAMQAWFAKRNGHCVLIDARHWPAEALLRHLTDCAPALNEAGLLSVLAVAEGSDELREYCQTRPQVCRYISNTAWQGEAQDADALRDALLCTLARQTPPIVPDSYLPGPATDDSGASEK